MEIWSLFSGAMGLDLGLESVGLKPTLVVEKDKYCCETIRANMPDLDLIQGDVSRLTGDHLRSHRNFAGEVFLMVGGPPCQSFSPGGKRAALSDPRGNLIYEYLRLISEIRPRYFMFENVANLVTAALQHRKIKDRPGQHWNLNRYQSGQRLADDGLPELTADEMSGSAIRQLLKDIERLDYSVTLGVLDAADYGTPQHRLRFVMLGSANGMAPLMPEAKYGSIEDGKQPYRTVRDAIENIKLTPGNHSRYTSEVAYYFAQIPPGGNWRSLPQQLHATALGKAYYAGGGKTGFYRRLSWDQPAPTITGRANRKASAICHPEFTRPLSAKECARLQGFPDSWWFAGGLSQQYMQIGNAVPVELGNAIGKSILEASAGGFQLTDGPKPPNSVELMLDKAMTRLRASARNKKSRHPMQKPLFGRDI